MTSQNLSVSNNKLVETGNGGTSVSSAADDDTDCAAATPRSPTVDTETGEWRLNAWDVECLAVGAGIMGCGGGGSPYYGKLRVLRKLREGKVIRVIHPIR